MHAVNMRGTRGLLAGLSACNQISRSASVSAANTAQLPFALLRIASAVADFQPAGTAQGNQQLAVRVQRCLHQMPCCQFSSSSHAAVGSSMDTEASLGDSETLSEKDFHRHADHSLGELFFSLEDVIEKAGLAEADLEYSQGVMTIDLGKNGTYVINKQSPNKQLWMSSPISGPVRYDWSDGLWVYKRDGHVMTDKLEDELKKLLKLKDIDLEPPPVVGYGPDVT